MATKKDTFDITKEKPTSKTQITRDRMYRYIQQVGTEQDKEWFKALCKQNKKKIKSNLTGKVRDDIDIKPVREAFVDRFFGYLNEKDKDKNKSFFDKLDEL